MLGMGPLPSEKNILTQSAFGLRTWQFLSVLKAKHEARLVLIARKEHYKKAPVFGEWRKQTLFGKTVEVMHLDKDSRGFFHVVKKAYEDFKPDACLGVNHFAAYTLAQLKPKLPFWADLNGWMMAEAQSQAFVDQNDSYISTLWARERLILQTADRFSTVSEAQRLATYGELAALGRLNSKTEEEELLHTIPNANELPTAKVKTPAWRESLPKDAFIILFSGAYNTWLDGETLFKGLEMAMEENKSIHFVSTGGPVANLANEIFQRFYKRCEGSKFKDHFHFLGWLTKEELIETYGVASIGINVDRMNNEAAFGARNRINEWIQYEVPVCTTITTEMSHELEYAGVILGVEPEEPKDLAAALLAATKLDLKAMAKAAKDFSKTEWSYKKTTDPLLEWLKAPQKAGDKGYTPPKSLLSKIRFRLRRDGPIFLLKWLWKKIR